MTSDDCLPRNPTPIGFRSSAMTLLRPYAAKGSFPHQRNRFELRWRGGRSVALPNTIAHDQYLFAALRYGHRHHDALRELPLRRTRTSHEQYVGTRFSNVHFRHLFEARSLRILVVLIHQVRWNLGRGQCQFGAQIHSRLHDHIKGVDPVTIRQHCECAGKRCFVVELQHESSTRRLCETRTPQSHHAALNGARGSWLDVVLAFGAHV